jgi:magnesium transporter
MSAPCYCRRATCLATKHLLELLAPEQLKVACTLLGYPPGSIGRPMTPDYIAVRENWSIQEVLDYIRTHGHDSETLTMIYGGRSGRLIDDIRIRNVLLAPLSNHVSDIMDSRFVALTATDKQETAISIFKENDRKARLLPTRPEFL